MTNREDPLWAAWEYQVWRSKTIYTLVSIENKALSYLVHISVYSTRSITLSFSWSSPGLGWEEKQGFGMSQD